METEELLFREAYQLVSKGGRIIDPDWFRYRDLLHLHKSLLSAKCANYFESILNRAIDLTDAIKELETPWGVDLLSLKERRKHLDWLEKQKSFLKARLVR